MLFITRNLGRTATGKPFLYFIRRVDARYSYVTNAFKATWTWLPDFRTKECKPVFFLFALWTWLDVAGDRKQWDVEHPMDLNVSQIVSQS